MTMKESVGITKFLGRSHISKEFICPKEVKYMFKNGRVGINGLVAESVSYFNVEGAGHLFLNHGRCLE